MAAREDTIERIEKVLKRTHKKSITVTIPRLTAERAVSMLKEQEPIPVIQREVMHMLFWCCGSCGVAITDGDKFCRNCGQAVKWNE